MMIWFILIDLGKYRILLLSWNQFLPFVVFWNLFSYLHLIFIFNVTFNIHQFIYIFLKKSMCTRITLIKCWLVWYSLLSLRSTGHNTLSLFSGQTIWPDLRQKGNFQIHRPNIDSSPRTWWSIQSRSAMWRCYVETWHSVSLEKSQDKEEENSHVVWRRNRYGFPESGSRCSSTLDDGWSKNASYRQDQN